MSNKPSKLSLADLSQQVVATFDADDPAAHSNINETMISRQQAVEDFGQIHIISTKKVDPALCRPSKLNARDYTKLTYENCEDLISSIREEGQQNTPALVRRISKPDGEAKYEIVAGSRRHFAVSWLRANNYPQIQYLIEVRDMGDEEAFRLSDEENRARKDVTDLERGRAYRDALHSYYNGNVVEMAKRLSVGERTLRRYVKLAELPQVVIDAYGGQDAITTSHGREADTQISKRSDNIQPYLSEAEQIAKEQDELRKSNKPLIPPVKVAARLAKVGTTIKKNNREKVVKDSAGNEMFVYTAPTSIHSLTFKISKNYTGDNEKILSAMSEILEKARS